MKERSDSAAAAGQCARRRLEGSSVPVGCSKVLQGCSLILSETVEEAETVEESSGGTLQQWAEVCSGITVEAEVCSGNRKPATEPEARGVYLGPWHVACSGTGSTRVQRPRHLQATQISESKG